MRRAIAVVSAVGLAVAGYLTWVHLADAIPLCVAGSGGCERVQTSAQSELAGVPVALLGLLGYAAIGLTALVRTEPARVAGALLALVGFGFSAWLTYAELFVIEALCQWCVVSAVLMTALAVLASLRLVRGDGDAGRDLPEAAAASA